MSKGIEHSSMFMITSGQKGKVVAIMDCPILVLEIKQYISLLDNGKLW